MHPVRVIVAGALALGLALLLATLAWAAPVLSIDDGPAGPTTDRTPQFTFAVDETATSVECSIVADQATPVYGECSGATTHQPDRPLDDGDYVFWIQASDGVDPPTERSQAFSVDTVAQLSLQSGPTDPTRDTAPTFGFTLEAGASAECWVDADTPVRCDSPYTSAQLSDGRHTFHVHATDALGNEASDTQDFTVDTTPPSLSIGAGQAGPTNDATPSFAFTATDANLARVQCWVDSDTPARCGSPYTSAPLSNGRHTLHVQATDALGNASPVADLDFTVDTVRPAVRVTSGPTITNVATPSFEFTATDTNPGSVACWMDQGTPVRCDSPYTSVHLSDGRHTFHVQATDAAGNQGSDTRDVTVDSEAPSLTIDPSPDETNDTTPSLAFATEAGVSAQCSVDQGTPAWTRCTSPYTPAVALPEGRSTFRVRVADAGGNLASDSRTFTVDTTPPSLSITLGPQGVTNDSTPLFGFTAEAGATVACSIDQGTPAYGACASATTYAAAAPLADGDYVFRVLATDRAGNQLAATRAFTVDTAPPTPPASTGTTPPPALQLLSPFPIVRISGTVTATGVRIRLLSVRAPRGALVRVMVRPACGRSRRLRRCRVVRAARTVGRSDVIGFRALARTYRSGTVIVVLVWRADRIGKYTRFTIVRGKAPRRVDQCLVPGATRGSRCPSA